MRIESLEEYVLVAQDCREVTHHARDCDWRPEVLNTADAPLVLKSLEFRMPLAAVYEEVSG